ncbi:transporter substrate-binding domain-containing protein [Aliamphritea spongicola]|nr:transporter substrate-binding domain-containing protein [Aliamphritea spongicola]
MAPYTRMIDGQPGGITVDIMKAAAERAGFDISFRNLPWQRCIVMVQRGEYDFALDAVERPGLIHGDHPNALYVQAFWLREGMITAPMNMLASWSINVWP